MTGVIIEIGPITGVNETIQAEERRIEILLVDGVDDVLDFAGQVQAESYTATGNPPQPPGSTYQRTFDLARSSKKHLTRRKLPIIAGEWYSDPGVASYNEYVIGPRSRQAAIHQGRWKSEEDVEREVSKNAARIIQERFS